MPVTVNGTTLKQMTFNGAKVKKWNHNGTRVFTAGSTVTYWVDTNTSYTEEVDSEASCLSPKTFTPSKSGWTFVGWREDKTASSNVLSNKVMADSPITLYAVFRATITVTYYNNSTSASTATGYRYYNNANVLDPSFTLTQASKSGWSARGWSTSNIGNAGITYNSGVAFTRSSNVTLYGLYQQTITLSYNGNGSTSGSVGNQTGTRYWAPAGAIDPSFTLAANGFAKTNYYWTAWAMGSTSGTQYANGASVTLSANTTFYACWAIIRYTITYIYGGVSTAVTYDIGSNITNYTPAAVSGRTFVGWNRSNTGTTAESLTATGNMTLYGIGKVSGEASQTVSIGTIDRYDDENNHTGSDNHEGFTAPSSVPLNTPVTLSVSFYTTWGANDWYSGNADVYVGGLSVAVNFNGIYQTKTASTTGNLANRSGGIGASSPRGSFRVEASITYSWTSYVVG